MFLHLSSFIPNKFVPGRLICARSLGKCFEPSVGLSCVAFVTFTLHWAQLGWEPGLVKKPSSPMVHDSFNCE